jgi:hypothetical protein
MNRDNCPYIRAFMLYDLTKKRMGKKSILFFV